MPWTVTFDPEHGLVETVYAGRLSRAELFQAAEETLALGQAHGTTLFLGDCRDLAGGHSTLDLYQLSELVKRRAGLAAVKEALLMPGRPASLADVRFWETTSRNRGLVVRLFGNRASALAWLQADGPASGP